MPSTAQREIWGGGFVSDKTDKNSSELGFIIVQTFCFNKVSYMIFTNEYILHTLLRKQKKIFLLEFRAIELTSVVFLN